MTTLRIVSVKPADTRARSTPVVERRSLLKTARKEEEEAPSPVAMQPGRARSHRRILDAAFSLFAESGYSNLTIEGVAARAGVAKTTIYRWWPSKTALVVAAAEDLAASLRTPDTGEVRGDLVAFLRDVIRICTTTVAGRLMPALIADMAEHPDLAEAIGGFWTGRREIILDVLKRGVARGELRPDIDIELAADLLLGPIYYRLLIRRAPLKPKYADHVVDAVLRGKSIGER